MSARTTVALSMVGIGLGIVGLRALSDATLSTHHRVHPGSQIELVVDGRIKGSEAGQTLAEQIEAQIVVCRLEVASDLVGELEQIGPGRYRAILSPSMDETNRRQFRGCLEDWVVDQVRLDVVSLIPL